MSLARRSMDHSKDLELLRPLSALHPELRGSVFAHPESLSMVSMLSLTEAEPSSWEAYLEETMDLGASRERLWCNLAGAGSQG